MHCFSDTKCIVCQGLTIRGKMSEAAVDLMIQRATKVAAWIPVNKCTWSIMGAMMIIKVFQGLRVHDVDHITPCRVERGAGMHGQAGACWRK